MSAWWILARREIAERRVVFLPAIVFGLLPPLTPVLAASVVTPAEQGTVALVAMMVFAGPLALLVGGSVLGRDLAERRLGFYLSRPASAAAIWSGKVLGGVILVIASAALVLLPTLVAGGVGPLDRGQVEAAAAGASAMVVLVAIGCACGIALRSRSRWLIVDFTLCPLLAAAAFVAARRLAMSGAVRGFVVSVSLTALICVAALLGASLAAVMIGRTDIQRAHRTLSLVLWSTAGAAVFVLFLYTGWVYSATPGDIAYGSVAEVAPRGTWALVVSDLLRGRFDYQPLFLVDFDSGRYLNFVPDQLQSVAFSGDGSTAAWTECLPRPPADRRDRFHDRFPVNATWISWMSRLASVRSSAGQHPDACEVFKLELGDTHGVPERTGLHVRRRDQLALDPAGRRLAVFGSGAAVYDLGTRQRQFRAVTPRIRDAFFVDGQRLRLFGEAEVVDVDLRSGRSAMVELPPGEVVASPNGRDFISWNRDLRSLDLIDGCTGTPLGHLENGFASAMFLRDGRIVTVHRSRLRVFSGDGVERREVDLPLDLDKRPEARLGAEVAPGKVVVGYFDSTGASGIRVVDVATGELSQAVDGLFPSVYAFVVNSVRVEPGSYASKLFQQDGALIYFDPLTGDRRTLLPQVASAGASWRPIPRRIR